jgi:protein-S-isoprenylcysteine O-methyltransferase Ste14
LTVLPDTPEWVFRVAVLVVLLDFGPIGLFFRLRAAKSRETLDRSQEGWVLLISLRLLGLLMILSTLAYLIRPAAIAWAQVPIPGALRWCGAPIAVAGAALFFWTLNTLGNNLTDTVVTRQAHTLVTEGPYRWVRHPFYLAALAGGVGTGLLAANLLILGVTLGVFRLLVLRTPIEERHLADRFGEAYEAYRRQVPAFWPRAPRAPVGV